MTLLNKHIIVLFLVVTSAILNGISAQNATYQIQQCEKDVASLEKKFAKETWNTQSQLSYTKHSLEYLRKDIDALKKKDPSYDVSEFEAKYKVFSEKIKDAGEGVANNHYSNPENKTKTTTSTNNTASTNNTTSTNATTTSPKKTSTSSSSTTNKPTTKSGSVNVTYQVSQCEKYIASLNKKLLKEKWNTKTQLGYAKEGLSLFKRNLDQLKKKDPSYDVSYFDKQFKIFEDKIISAGEGVPNNHYYTNEDYIYTALTKPIITSTNSSGKLTEADDSPAVWEIRKLMPLLELIDGEIDEKAMEELGSRVASTDMIKIIEKQILAVEAKDENFNTSEFKTIYLKYRDSFIKISEPYKAIDANYYGRDTYIIQAIFNDTIDKPDVVSNKKGVGRHYSSFYYSKGRMGLESVSSYYNPMVSNGYIPVLMDVDKCCGSDGSIKATMTFAPPKGVDTTTRTQVVYNRVTNDAPNFYLGKKGIIGESNYKYCFYMDNGDMVFFNFSDYTEYNISGYVLFSKTKSRVRSSRDKEINTEEIEKQLKAAIVKIKQACASKKSIVFSSANGENTEFHDGDRITARLETSTLLADFPSGKPLVEVTIVGRNYSDNQLIYEKMNISSNILTTDIFPSTAPAGSKEEGKDLKELLFSVIGLSYEDSKMIMGIADERGCPTESGYHYYGELIIKHETAKGELKYPKYGAQYAESVEKYSTAKLPEPATRDAALEQAVLSGVNPSGGKVTKVILRSVDWNIMRNQDGVILYRYRPITFCTNQPEGYCAFETYDISQQYNGDGYSKNLKIKGMSYIGGLQGIQCAKIK